MRDDTGTLPNTETSAIPSTPSYSDYFAQLSSHAPHHSEYNEQLDVDMDLDSSSTTSSVDNSKELSGLSSNTMHLDIDLPPPPPPPSF
jgi:isopenicillin N synthase-like dioxygenase